MLYCTRRMIAKQPMTYLGERLEPGEVFMATDLDGAYLARIGRAADVSDAPPADAPHATATPPRVRGGGRGRRAAIAADEAPPPPAVAEAVAPEPAPAEAPAQEQEDGAEPGAEE